MKAAMPKASRAPRLPVIQFIGRNGSALTPSGATAKESRLTPMTTTNSRLTITATSLAERSILLMPSTPISSQAASAQTHHGTSTAATSPRMDDAVKPKTP